MSERKDKEPGSGSSSGQDTNDAFKGVMDMADTYQVRDPDKFAQNLAQVAEEAGKAWSAYLEPREKGEAALTNTDEIARIVKTLNQVGEYWLSDPRRMVEAQSRLMTSYLSIWSNSLRRMGGDAPAETPVRDKRFADPEWSKNEFFHFLRDMYLSTSKWADSLVDEAADLDDHTRQKAGFYVKQIAGALSPTNFIMTNPELLRETLEQNGGNLVKGIRMLAEDIRRGHGDLKLRQSDPSKFKVGVNLATTPGKVVMRNDVCELLQYTPTTNKVLKRPLLICPPWINKFYILDLNPEKSFIRWAVEQGHTVFVISWVNPDERQARKSFEHYMKEGVIAALDHIEKATGEREVNSVGYCVGGTLLSVSLAYLAAVKDTRIASATLFTTQVDFTHAGDLKVFVDEEQISALEAEMNKKGYLEGRRMANSFNMLRANDLIWPYVVNNYLRGRDPLPFDLLFWNSDSTRMPAANHSFYLRHCYLNNDLSNKRMVVGGETLDLSKVTIPIYNLAAREDHIAPAKSVYLGSTFFGGEVTYVVAGSGHIAGVINPPEKKKYQFWTNGPVMGDGTLDAWLEKATETPGSWWPHWQEWIEAMDNRVVAARVPGDNGIEVLGDAPGTYVAYEA